MADDERSEEPAAPAPRRELRKPGSDPEKALTLEVARLFGMSPRDLVSRRASAEGAIVDPDAHGREHGDGQGDDLVAGDGDASEGVGSPDVAGAMSEEKKPPKVSWETWVDRKIRESMERGEFDNLPGKGQPIPDLARPYDELWWLRKKLRDEQLSIDPPTLVLRRELADTVDRVATARSEAEVRRLVAAINERIVYVNSHTTFGPPSDLVPLNVERVVAEWRERNADR